MGKTMTTKKTGGPAFPLLVPGSHCTDGMTLRDWFAGQALAGMLSTEIGFERRCDHQCREAYRYADAMLEARDK